MKMLKKIIIFSFVISFLLIPFNKVTYAKDEATGVKNDLNGSSQKAYDSLPSDQELQSQIKNQKLNVGDTSNKKVGKGKGELYKAYKSEIDKYIKDMKAKGVDTKDLKKTAKNYNTETGKLDGVAMWDIEGHLTNMGLNFGKFAIDVATEPLKTFTLKPADILDAPSAKPMMQAFNGLTDILIALFLIFQLGKIMITRAIDIGYNGQLVYDKVVKTFTAVVLVSLYEPLFKMILNFQYLLITPILKSIDINDSMAGQIALNGMLVDSSGIMFILPFVALILLVVTLSLFYSLALMIVLFIVGPVAIATMMNDDMEFFSLWLRKVVSRILTLLLQSLCIAMSFATLFRITFDYKQTITDYGLGISFLFVALSVPKMLENYGDSSGAGRSTMMFIRSVGRRK